MTGAREVIRRVLVWALLALYFGLCVVMIVTSGQWWVLIAWTGFPIVGAVILNARSGNSIGRLLLGIGIYWPLYGVLLAPEVVAALPVAVELLVTWIGYLVWIALPFVLLLFPTGRLETGVSRIIAWSLAALALVMLLFAYIDPAPLFLSGRHNPYGIDAVGAISSVFLGDGSFVIVPTFVVGALIDLIVRWTRSAGVQRLQFRWLAFGGAVTLVTIFGTFLSDALSDETAGIFIVGLSAIPIAIGIAVTRHGLYEIGRVVSRTVSYAIVTALAIGVYAAIVTSATLLLPDAPAVGVALATLAAAALFLPALRWVQRSVDRRFDRERYDAQKVVDAFGERLRTGADPATTAPELIHAVERTLQPAGVGIWTTGDAR